MSSERNAIALRLGHKVNLAERRFDETIKIVAELLTELPAVRMQGGVGAEFGQPAVEHLTAAIGALGKARGDLVAAHKSMASAATTLDFETFTGDAGAKPKDPPMGVISIAA